MIAALLYAAGYNSLRGRLLFIGATRRDGNDGNLKRGNGQLPTTKDIAPTSLK
jgi:hypothetical protein